MRPLLKQLVCRPAMSMAQPGEFIMSRRCAGQFREESICCNCDPSSLRLSRPAGDCSEASAASVIMEKCDEECEGNITAEARQSLRRDKSTRSYASTDDNETITESMPCCSQGACSPVRGPDDLEKGKGSCSMRWKW